MARIALLSGFVFLIGASFSVAQYYYFDSGTVTYPYQQGCAETLNVRINTELNPDGAKAGLLRLLLDPSSFSYSTSSVATDLRSDLFNASSATFADWSSSSSPSWKDGVPSVLQLDRKNNLISYTGNGGLYGTLILVPVYSPTTYDGFVGIVYDGDTVKTSLSKAGGVNIINPVYQAPYLTGIYDVLQEPCTSDTINPVISITTPQDSQTKQSYISGITLSLTDNGSAWPVPYVWTGGNLWTGNVWSITNQYGIDLSTFQLTISGNEDSKSFVGNSFDTGDVFASLSALPSGKTWQYLDKNYAVNVLSGEIFDYGIEQEITITSSVRDRNNRLRALGSFKFNSPVGPRLLGSRSPNANAEFVDTDVPVMLGIQDDRAGVNSGSIYVTLQGINGTSYGPYMFTGDALNLSGVVSSANQPNYYLTISGHIDFPSSGTIQVLVDAEDMEGSVDTIGNYSFGTRPSCAQLGCCNQVSLQTGNNPSVLYDKSKIYISGGNNPLFSTGIGDGTGYIDCNVPIAGLPIYEGEGINTGSAQFVSFFSFPQLVFSGASDVRIVLDGNTVYLSRIPSIIPPPGGGGGGGGGGVTKDNCLLPGSSLPGANYEGIDYSPSFYDDDCRADEVHEAAPTCPVDPDVLYDQELIDAFQFAYDVGMTNKCPIEDARLDDNIKRKELVKMLVYFTVEVMGVMPDEKKLGCDKYADMDDSSDELKYYTKLGCQLELMGMKPDGVTPMENFLPEDSVTRAQFATTLSRLIFGRKYAGDQPYWYSKHLAALKEFGIIKLTIPDLLDKRGFIMLMFKRTADSGLVEQYRLSAAARNGAIALKY